MTAQEILGNLIERLRVLIRALSGAKAEQSPTAVRRRKTRVFFEMP